MKGQPGALTAASEQATRLTASQRSTFRAQNALEADALSIVLGAALEIAELSNVVVADADPVTVVLRTSEVLGAALVPTSVVESRKEEEPEMVVGSAEDALMDVRKDEEALPFSRLDGS